MKRAVLQSLLHRIMKKSGSGVLGLLLIAGLLLSGCRGSEGPGTETAAPSSAEATSSIQEESTEKSSETEPQEASTEKTEEETKQALPEADPEAVLSAWQAYYDILLEKEEEIRSWEPDEDYTAEESGVYRNTAFCDIAFDTAPEFLYVEASENGGTGCRFHIVSMKEDGPAEVYASPENSEECADRHYCFFTVSGDRRLYEYCSPADGGFLEGWYYYETQDDGTLARKELTVAGEEAYFYQGQECPEESYRELTGMLLSGMENVLFYQPLSIFRSDLDGASSAVTDFGMNADEAVSFLKGELYTGPETNEYPDVLMDFVRQERYLEAGQEYYTDAGAAEITFGLYDFNGDAYPELLISNGSPNLTQRVLHVYGFSDAAFHYLGDAGFRECNLYTAPGSAYRGVFCTGGDSGFIMDFYYELQEDGSIRSEMVASYEDTSFKVESHDEQRVTQDLALYEAWANARPLEGREASYIPMMTEEELVQALPGILQNAGSGE